MLRPIRKQLTCGRCGAVLADAVLADAVLRLWRGLTITALQGWTVQPSRGGLQLRFAEQQLAAAPAHERARAQERVDFVGRNVAELFYDLRCPCGHSMLWSAPDIAHTMKRTSGRWVSLQ